VIVMIWWTCLICFRQRTSHVKVIKNFFRVGCLINYFLRCAKILSIFSPTCTFVKVVVVVALIKLVVISFNRKILLVALLAKLFSFRIRHKIWRHKLLFASIVIRAHLRVRLYLYVVKINIVPIV